MIKSFKNFFESAEALNTSSGGNVAGLAGDVYAKLGSSTKPVSRNDWLSDEERKKRRKYLQMLNKDRVEKTGL